MKWWDLAQRSSIASIGICAIIWAVEAIPVYRAEASFTDISQRILSGERFNTAQLNAIRHQLDGAPAVPRQASASSSATIMRLLLLEEELKHGDQQPVVSDINELHVVVNAALAQAPTNSFAWLTAFWLGRLRGQSADDDLNLLRMSYWSGPNEAWIALKRNRLALGIVSSLPNDVAAQAVSEFVGLVRSGLYPDAANILAGPGWSIHERLVNSLTDLDETDRHRFARELAWKNIDVTVPGVDRHPDRPF